MVPSALSLLVGRIGSLRPLVQIGPLLFSKARADGANRDAAAHAATAGTSCRLLHLKLEGADIAGETRAAARGCTGVGESRPDGARSSASIDRSDAQEYVPISKLLEVCRRWISRFPRTARHELVKEGAGCQVMSCGSTEKSRKQEGKQFFSHRETWWEVYTQGKWEGYTTLLPRQQPCQYSTCIPLTSLVP